MDIFVGTRRNCRSNILRGFVGFNGPIQYMKRILPQSFRFSPLVCVISLGLAAVMLRASFWQWSRYHYKVDLVKSYQSTSTSQALPFPAQGLAPQDFSSVLNRKVRLSGTYDFAHEMIVLNRSHASGPGFWLLTPLKIDGTNNRVIVSRGFIPFADSSPASWEKYRFSAQELFDAVVQASVPHRSYLTPDSVSEESSDSFQRKWFYPDIDKIARQLPYPLITPVFLQHLGSSPHGLFPAQSVSVDVPPSTHFGYTIEWALLATASIVVGFLVQAFPRGGRRPVFAPHSPKVEAVPHVEGEDPWRRAQGERH